MSILETCYYYYALGSSKADIGRDILYEKLVERSYIKSLESSLSDIFTPHPPIRSSLTLLLPNPKSSILPSIHPIIPSTTQNAIRNPPPHRHHAHPRTRHSNRESLHCSSPRPLKFPRNMHNRRQQAGPSSKHHPRHLHGV